MYKRGQTCVGVCVRLAHYCSVSGEGLKVLRVKRNRLGKWLPSWYEPRTKGGGHLRMADGGRVAGRRILLFLFRTRPTSPSYRTPPPTLPPPLLERDKTFGVLLCSAMISIAHPTPHIYTCTTTHATH